MKKWIGLWMLLLFIASCSDDETKLDAIELSASMLNYDSEGGEQSVLIQASAEWQVLSDATWCFVKEEKETGQFFVIVSENPDFNSRMTVLKLSAGNCVKEIDVQQKGKTTKLALSSNEAFAYDLNDNYAVVLHAESAWKASVAGNWFTVEPSSGEAGTHLIRLSFSQNKTQAERLGTISFESEDCANCLFKFTQGAALPDSRYQDSLALLKIYDAIGGDELKAAGYLKNWKEGPLENWHPYLMRDGRVVNLRLEGNIGNGRSIPDDVKYLSHLEEFFASSTGVGGELPVGLGRCVALKAIRISYFFEDIMTGNISGELPKNWCTLKNLQAVDLYGNKISGSLPLEYANMPQLKIFQVSKNELTGELPAIWSIIPGMYNLLLVSNKFTGEIPEEWSLWSQLAVLDVAKNSGLFGKVPAGVWTNCQNNGGYVGLNGTNIIQ